MMRDKVVQDIVAERERQLSKEGWSLKHDDEHCESELASAAAAYASPVTLYEKVPLLAGDGYVDAWPWIDGGSREPHRSTERVKRGKSRRRQLVIAAALIVAEIERLDRIPPQDTPNDQ